MSIVLPGELLEHRAVEIRLRGLDRDRVDGALGELREERIPRGVRG